MLHTKRSAASALSRSRSGASGSSFMRSASQSSGAIGGGGGSRSVGFVFELDRQIDR